MLKLLPKGDEEITVFIATSQPKLSGARERAEGTHAAALVQRNDAEIKVNWRESGILRYKGIIVGINVKNLRSSCIIHSI